MKFSLLLTAVISIASISFAPTKSVQAKTFSEKEVDQNQFAVIAAPYHHGYNLVLVEQISGQRQCWSEKGAFPVEVEPLFLNFDFTNACKRSSDSNNYSIRINGKDYGMDYLVEIVKQNGELHLIGVPRDRTKPQLHIGRTHGLSSGSLKIVLNPQWRLTKRAYGQSLTDHIYLSHNSGQSTNSVSHVSQATPVAQQSHHSSGVRPSQANYQNPVYQQPSMQPAPQTVNHNPVVYQQPVYQVPVAPQQPMGNVYQQPVYQVPVAPQQPMGNVYQQPVYQVPVAPQQPMGNVYQQPVHPVQSVNNSYTQY